MPSKLQNLYRELISLIPTLLHLPPLQRALSASTESLSFTSPFFMISLRQLYSLPNTRHLPISAIEKPIIGLRKKIDPSWEQSIYSTCKHGCPLPPRVFKLRDAINSPTFTSPGSKNCLYQLHLHYTSTYPWARHVKYLAGCCQ